MPVIYKLIKTLTPLEIEQISRLPFQERERAVLQKLLHLKSVVFPSSTICKNLNISTSHLDKINSRLLKKVLENLAGKNIYDQVNYFESKYGLTNASERILKQYEQKVICSSSNKKAKFTFYKFCFEWILSTSPLAHHLKDANRYANLMLENCTKKMFAETALWIRINLLRKEIDESRLQAVFTDPLKQTMLFTKLNSIINESEAIHSPIYVYKAKLNGVLLNNITKRFEESRKYIDDINKLISTNKSEFTSEDKLNVKWHYAQILFFSGEFEESFNIYNAMYDKINKQDVTNWYVYIIEYFQVCLITKKYKQAQEICNSFFSKYLDDQNGKYFLSAMIQYVKYLLHTDQYEDAKTKITILHKYMSKTASLQFQLALRELTLAFQYLTGNFSKALILAEKNLKFMRTKKIHKLIPEYTYHSRLLKSIIKSKNRKTPVDKEEEQMLETMLKGTTAQYGGLLVRLIQD